MANERVIRSYIKCKFQRIFFFKVMNLNNIRLYNKVVVFKI